MEKKLCVCVCVGEGGGGEVSKWSESKVLNAVQSMNLEIAQRKSERKVL